MISPVNRTRHDSPRAKPRAQSSPLRRRTSPRAPPAATTPMPPDRTTTPPEPWGRSRTAADQQNRSTAAVTGRATIPRAEAAPDAGADFCLAFSVWLIAGGERWRGPGAVARARLIRSLRPPSRGPLCASPNQLLSREQGIANTRPRKRPQRPTDIVVGCFRRGG